MKASIQIFTKRSTNPHNQLRTLLMQMVHKMLIHSGRRKHPGMKKYQLGNNKSTVRFICN
jgi:hypothetical protein